jgi:hypothetical protein
LVIWSSGHLVIWLADLVIDLASEVHQNQQVSRGFMTKTPSMVHQRLINDPSMTQSMTR